MIKLKGKVIKGLGYGKKLGFPTANLDRRDYARRKLNIKFGVYAGVGEFIFHAKRYMLKAGIVIGPLDKYHFPKIEAYLLGFNGNLYGKIIELTLFKFLRSFKEFQSEKKLKEQIQKDINLIQKIIK